MSTDPFHVLGIPRNASKEDIKNAYRKKVLQYHPDRHHGSPESVRLNAEKQFAVRCTVVSMWFCYVSLVYFYMDEMNTCI